MLQRCVILQPLHTEFMPGPNSLRPNWSKCARNIKVYYRILPNESDTRLVWTNNADRSYEL